MFSVQVIITFVTFLGMVLALPPPSYLKPCHTKDPNFNKCLLETSNKVYPEFIKGDKKYKFPALNPLKLPLIEIKQNSFQLNLKDVTVFGLDTLKFTNIELTEDKMYLEGQLDNIQIIGTYTVDGKLLFLPLKGDGPANITGINGHVKFNSKLKTVDKAGESHLVITESDLEYKLDRAYFHFENLLNSENLGIDVNQLLNDSWEDVLKDVGSGLKSTISQVYNLIVSNLFDSIPKKDILPA